MADYPNHREAARALLNHQSPALQYKIGQFLGGIMFSDRPLTEKQERWLSDLLRSHGLPGFISEGRA